MISGQVWLLRNNGVAILRRGGTLLGRRKVSVLSKPPAPRGSNSVLAVPPLSAGENETERSGVFCRRRYVLSRLRRKNSGAFVGMWSQKALPASDLKWRKERGRGGETQPKQHEVIFTARKKEKFKNK